MRRVWLILLLCLSIACSDAPASTPMATNSATDVPIATDVAYPIDENTTFLPVTGIDDDAVEEDEPDVAEDANEAYPVATPVPISPRPEVIAEETDEVEETVDEQLEDEESAAVNSETTTYTVQRGDILGFIARDFGVSVDELMAANGIDDPNQIEAGQVLVIPSEGVVEEVIEETEESAEETETEQETVVDEEESADEEVVVIEEPTPTAEPATPQTYIVQPGDSLGNIAERFDISLTDLAAANGLSVTSFVYVDQVLTIPTENTPIEPAQTYVVQSGDTLRIIADRFGITIDALSTANNITNPNAIFVGQTLIVPNP